MKLTCSVVTFSLLFAASTASGELPETPTAHAPCTSLPLTGDLTKVISACATLIEGDTLKGRDRAEALRHQGDAYFRSRRVNRALADYEDALAITPDWPLALWNRGNALAFLGDPARAEENYYRALEVDPLFGKAFTALGISALWKGDAEGALRHSSKALELDPSDHHARLNRAMINMDLGRHDEVLRDGETLLKVPPAELNEVYVHWPDRWKEDVASVARHTYARALVETKSWQEAKTILQANLADNPEYLPSTRLLNTIYVFYEQDNSKALALLDAAIERQPDYWELRHDKARVLAFMEDMDGVRRMLADTARFEVEGDGTFFIDRGKIRRMIGDYDEAAQDFESAMSASYGSSMELFRRLQRRGHLPDAAGHPETVVTRALAACARDFEC